MKNAKEGRGALFVVEAGWRPPPGVERSGGKIDPASAHYGRSGGASDGVVCFFFPATFFCWHRGNSLGRAGALSLRFELN